MKKRLLGIIFILVPVLAAMFSFVACSKAKKYSVTFDIDISKYDIGYWTSESKTFTSADTENMMIQLNGFDMYDYSDVKVLLNGEENSECFTNNYQKPEEINGASVNIGSIELNGIKKDTVVTVTGAKDRTVKIAFVDATDDRLGNDKVDLSEMGALEQSAYRNMMLQFGTTFKTKVSDADYQYLQSLGIDEQYIEKDEYGYIYALNLLTDDHGNVLYEKDNPGYVKSNWKKLIIRPFLTPTPGAELKDNQHEIEIQHTNFTEIIRKVDITEQVYYPSKEEEGTITTPYYAHVGIIQDKENDNFTLFANWDYFLDEYFMTAGKANEKLVKGIKTSDSKEKLIESFHNYAPSLYNVLTNEKSNVKAVKGFKVGEDTLNVMATTVTSVAGIDGAKDELINTCTDICTEINTTTHLAVWRRYLRTVWLHI